MDTNTYYSGMGKFSTQVAIGSFACGTLLLLLGMLFPYNENLMFTGAIYIIIAFTLNVMVLLGLAYCCLKTWAQREYYAKKMLVVIGNIPVAFLYFFIILYVYN